MASNTRAVEAVGVPVFDFNTQRRGTISFFSNDLNIHFRVVLQAPGVLLQVHAGPIMFLTTQQVGADVRVQLIPLSIGTGFPPPPLSLVQLQTDTVNQVPSVADVLPSVESDPWEQS